MTIKTTDRNGFHMQFANGYVVSVQWNAHNYCDKRDLNASLSEFRNPMPRECARVEVGAWDSVTGDWVALTEIDKVAGWQTMDELLVIMNKVAALEPTVTEVPLALSAPDQ